MMQAFFIRSTKNAAKNQECVKKCVISALRAQKQKLTKSVTAALCELLLYGGDEEDRTSRITFLTKI